MSDNSHAKFYSQLEDWVRREQNRYLTCQSVLNNALDKYWELARNNASSLGVQPNSQCANTTSIEITRSSSRRLFSRQSGRNRISYSRFRLPTIRKRFLAELIDAIIVLSLKLILIYFMADNGTFYDFIHSFPQEIVDLIPGYRFASRLVSMPAAYYDALQHGGSFNFERFHREIMYGGRYETPSLSDTIGAILWVLFEIYFVSKSVFDFGPGGCSIGKYLLDLRIISCNHRVNLPDAVDISPASNPGLFRALVRAALKNTGVSVWSSLLQILLTGDPVWSYDIMAGTVVVQLPEIDQPE
ncbi:hypothetical protein Aperf_G00000073399 [Anoplocephala perfoliata]